MRNKIVLFIILIVIIGAIAGLYFWKNYSIEQKTDNIPAYMLVQSPSQGDIKEYIPTEAQLNDGNIKAYESVRDGVWYYSEKTRKEILSEIATPKYADGWVAVSGSNTYETHSILKLKNRSGAGMLIRVEDVSSGGSNVYILQYDDTRQK